eukprot:XP_001611236.1 hypothetical protein [Babesia bovis T2Bo]
MGVISMLPSWVSKAQSRMYNAKSIYSIRVQPFSSTYDPDKMMKLYQNVHRPDDDMVDADIIGLTSSIAGACWHKAALTEYVDSEYNRQDDPNEQECNRMHSPYSGFQQTKEELLKEMQLLMKNDREQQNKLRLMLAKQHKLQIDHEHHMKKVNTMTLLKIAKQISTRKPAEYGLPTVAKRRQRERQYYRNLQRVDNTKPPEDESFYRKVHTDSNELVKVLDVDRIPVTLLHHMLCYTLVKHTPAEAVLSIVSRIAVLRDNNKHTAYQSILRDVARLVGPVSRAEVVALLSRCYQSISIPFMVDYVRRFGTFSRKFMAKLIQQQANPLPLDFLRYKAHQKAPNQLVTRPWALFGYVKKLKKSSAKMYMYHNLLARGYVPDEKKFDAYHAFGTLDTQMANTILNAERMLNDTVEFNKQKEDPLRPKIIDDVIEAQMLGIPLQEVQEETKYETPTKTSTQLVKIQTHIAQEHSKHTTGYLNIDDTIKPDRSHISWTVPWGRKRDTFHFKGNTQQFNT